jgi:hypothetical protein
MTGSSGPALALGQMLDLAATRDPSQEAIVLTSRSWRAFR